MVISFRFCIGGAIFLFRSAGFGIKTDHREPSPMIIEAIDAEKENFCALRQFLSMSF